jgi:3-phosphoshikimate 1-carboxyvinyltransferase
LAEEFGKLNIKVEIDDDTMLVTGGNVKGGHVDSHGDHRIAMATAVAALGASGKVFIKDSNAVNKSYPDFFGDLRHLGTMVYE